MTDHSFISWQSRDRDWVERLVADLRRLRVRVWWSGEELIPTGLWLPKVSAELETASFVIPVYTPEFFQSMNCLRELQAAILLEQKRRRFGVVVPALLREAQIPILLAVDPVVDFTDPGQYARSLAQLALRIGGARVPSRIDLSPKPDVTSQAIIVPESQSAWEHLTPRHRAFLRPRAMVGSALACPSCMVPLRQADIMVEQSGDGGAIYEPEAGYCCSRCGAGFMEQGNLLWLRPPQFVV